MTQEHAEIEHLLDAVGQVIDENLPAATPGRSLFFQALQALQQGQLPEATLLFRSAARTAEEPFNALAQNALAECERTSGREGAALRTWRKVANQTNAPHAIRYIAWMSIAALEEARGDEKQLQKARSALDSLGPPDDFTQIHQK